MRERERERESVLLVDLPVVRERGRRDGPLVRIHNSNVTLHVLKVRYR